LIAPDDTYAVLFKLDGSVPIPFFASLAVAEKMKKNFLGACGFHFGKYRIPQIFSGHTRPERQSENSNSHPYLICIPGNNFVAVEYLLFFHRRNYPEHDKKLFSYMNELTDFDTGFSWQLSLVCQGNVNDIVDNCPQNVTEFLKPSKSWISVTPFLKTRYLRIKRSEKHDKALYSQAIDREITNNINFELKNHKFPQAIDVSINSDHKLYPYSSGNQCDQFVKIRQAENLNRTIYGHSISITFEEPVYGPVVIGKHSHLGMGLFKAI